MDRWTVFQYIESYQICLVYEDFDDVLTILQSSMHAENEDFNPYVCLVSMPYLGSFQNELLMCQIECKWV